MTYKELYEKALWELEYGKINLGEFEDMIEPLNKEIPKEEQTDGDLISRADLLNETVNKNSIWNKITDSKGRNLEEIIAELPTIPQTAIKNFGAMECPKCGTLFYEVPTIETVLEDIKAEIEDLDIFYDNNYFSSNIEPMYKKNDVLTVIDKHISGKESEKEE